MQALQTDRLVIRPLERADADALYTVFGDREVMRFSLHGPLVSPDHCAALIDENRDRQARLGYSFWGVAERDGGRLVGTCGLAEFMFAPGETELAYRLRRDRWGRGYASEAAREVLAHAFGPLALPRVVAAVEPANTASVRVIEKCGFTFTRRTLMAGREALFYTLEAADFTPSGGGQIR